MTTSISHRLQYLLVLAMFGILRVMPRRARGWVGAGLGQLAYFTGIRRKVIADNLRAAFPSLPDRAVKVTIARIFRHFGCVATSLAGIPRLTKDAIDRWIFIENGEVVKEALAEGKGCLMVSGHIGNWEVGGAALQAQGIPTSFVVTTQRNKPL